MRPQLSERNTRLYRKGRCAAIAASEAKLFGRIYPESAQKISKEIFKRLDEGLSLILINSGVAFVYLVDGRKNQLRYPGILF
jgi:hypothetical protein